MASASQVRLTGSYDGLRCLKPCSEFGWCCRNCSRKCAIHATKRSEPAPTRDALDRGVRVQKVPPCTINAHALHELGRGHVEFLAKQTIKGTHRHAGFVCQGGRSPI